MDLQRIQAGNLSDPAAAQVCRFSFNNWATTECKAVGILRADRLICLICRLEMTFAWPLLTGFLSLPSPFPCRSLWTLAGSAWCGCPRGKPPAAPRPPGPGRPSTRFACAPTAGSSCRRPARAPPARSATTSASRTAADETQTRRMARIQSARGADRHQTLQRPDGNTRADSLAIQSHYSLRLGFIRPLLETLGLKLLIFQCLLKKKRSIFSLNFICLRV